MATHTSRWMNITTRLSERVKFHAIEITKVQTRDWLGRMLIQVGTVPPIQTGALEPRASTSCESSQKSTTIGMTTAACQIKTNNKMTSKTAMPAKHLSSPTVPEKTQLTLNENLKLVEATALIGTAQALMQPSMDLLKSKNIKISRASLKA